MSQHLPLVAAQPGIWMAEKLSDLPSAWSVAHYVELTGEVDAPLLARAVVAGLAQADTLRMRFTEDNGEVWQWVDDAQTFELPEIIDLRTNIDPHGTARALMQADLQQDLRVDSGKPLVFHQLIQVADNLVLVSALSPFAGRWLQFPGHYTPDRQHLLRIAAWRTNACFAVYAFR